MHVLKKPEEDIGVQPGAGKKHKKGKKNKAPKEGEPEPKLKLTVDVLNYFDMIKVTAPLYSKEIEDTAKLVREKKEYFIKTSDDINDGKDVEAEEKAANNTEEKAEKPEKQKKEK